MSKSRRRLRQTGERALPTGAKTKEARMKFMLLQNYGGVEAGVPPMREWKPEEVQAHIDYQKDLNAELRERGELVEAQALTAPQLAKFVLSDGSGSPVVTDGPFPESKELLAGYRMIDVESLDRALEIAARGSAAPGPGGEPIRQWIEVREVMGPIEH
jgi:hypothetical protein